MSTSSTPQLPDPKIYTIDVSQYPEDERVFRAMMHWKKLFPEEKSVRIGYHEESGTHAIAANQFGDRLEVTGLSIWGWHVDYQHWHDLKTDDPEIKKLFREGGQLFDQGHRNQTAMSAKLVGLQYRPWLGNSMLQLMDTLSQDETYRKNATTQINRVVVGHIEYCLQKLNAGYEIKVDPENSASFTWASTTRYASPVAPDKMLADLMKALPENTRHLVNVTPTGGSISIPENAFAWKPMSEEQAEVMLINARRQAALEGNTDEDGSKRDTSYDSLFQSPYNFTWIRNGFLQASIGSEMVYLTNKRTPYIIGHMGNSVEGSGAVIKDSLKLLDYGSQGTLRLDSLMSTVAPDAITSMAIHLQEKALRVEREALLKPSLVEPTLEDKVFPKNPLELQVGDHCAIGSTNFLNWCRVKERNGDIAKFWLINGAWAFDMDLSTGKCLPHELGMDLSDMAIVSTAKTPYEGVDSHYNEAIAFYEKLLDMQPQTEVAITV